MNRKFKFVAAVCNVQYISVNVHIVCDVIIARSCGTLAAIILLLGLDCVMQL